MLDLTGIGISQTIKGIQDAGVIACAKHFIGNEQVRLNDPSSLSYRNPVHRELSRE
jgi:beta-glucosidase